MAVGLKLDDDGLLYIAGNTGVARVLDTRSGRLVSTYQLTEAAGHFINDVTLLGDRAWFTDSRDGVLYGVPRGRKGEVRALPLTGDWVQTPDVNNANGIVGTPDGRGLIVVSSSPGKLYRVPLKTGHATEITLVGADGRGQRRRPLPHRPHAVRRPEPAEPRSACSTWTPRPAPPPCAARSPTPASTSPPPPPAGGDRLYLVNARFTSPQDARRRRSTPSPCPCDPRPFDSRSNGVGRHRLKDQSGTGLAYERRLARKINL